MKIKDLKTGDILKVDYSAEGFSIIYYVVMGNFATIFKGDINHSCSYPKGFFYLDDGEADLPENTVAIYRARFGSLIFNGDFDNEIIYKCIYRKQ